jgi:hypothetical protein
MIVLKSNRLVDEIKQEELGIKEANLNRLEEFLKEHENSSVTIEYHGTHYYENLDFTYTWNCKQIIISDSYNELLGTLEIDINNIFSVGLQLFRNDLTIEFIDGSIMNINVE